MDKMNKSKKLLELTAPLGTDFSKGDTTDVYSALAKLVKVFTSGKASQTQNPYTRPEVKEALKILAQQQGVKDHYDVDLDKFIK